MAIRVSKIDLLGGFVPDAGEVILCLDGGAEDGDLVSEAHQEELQRAAGRFDEQAPGVSAMRSLQKAFPGGSWLTGDFLVPLAQAVGPTLGVVLVAWLQGRAGRKVRVRFGDTEAEARTPEELERVLNLIKAHPALPTLVAAAGERASLRFLEFFAAAIAIHTHHVHMPAQHLTS